MNIETYRKAERLIEKINEYETALNDIKSSKAITLNLNSVHYVTFDNKSEVYEFLESWYTKSIEKAQKELEML